MQNRALTSFRSESWLAPKNRGSRNVGKQGEHRKQGENRRKQRKTENNLKQEQTEEILLNT